MLRNLGISEVDWHCRFWGELLGTKFWIELGILCVRQVPSCWTHSSTVGHIYHCETHVISCGVVLLSLWESNYCGEGETQVKSSLFRGCDIRGRSCPICESFYQKRRSIVSEGRVARDTTPPSTWTV